MLPRRIIRIYAMESLYDYYISTKVYLDSIKKKFDKSESFKILENNIIDYQITNNVDENHKLLIEDYINYIKEKRKYINQYYKNKEKNFGYNYLQIFYILFTWQNVAKEQLQKFKFINQKIDFTNFINNKIINNLKKDINLNGIDKTKDQYIKNISNNLLLELYNTVLKKDDIFKEYSDFINPSLKQDAYIFLHIVKNIICKNKILVDLFQNININWNINKEIILKLISKSVNKYVKNQEKNIKFDPSEIMTVDNEDQLFYQELVFGVLDQEKVITEIIQSKILNWDIKGIVLLDKIIILLASYEILYIPEIPYKVTIDEYLDIAKKYSTPKSNLFINGVLDALEKDKSKNYEK